jgi:steroid 5-alpha reductase family enzyme
MPPFAALMLQAWGLTAILMLILWLIAVKTKNAGWVDVGWTLGLAVCVWFYALSTDGSALRHWLLALAVSFWALRLINHLLLRFITDGHEDKRYQKIRADWKSNQDFKFFFFFQFQALLDVVLSTCWLPSMRNTTPGLHLLEIAGVLIWIIGFLGEILADHQLKVFKSNPANQGKTCQEGLWNYSRHPNYFFEWLMWVAYAVFACLSPWGWIAFLAVALMYHFLMNVSGVPLAEAQSLQSRGEEYHRYQQTTSMFVPLPKHKGGI